MRETDDKIANLAPHDPAPPRQRPGAQQVRDHPDRQELHPRPQRHAPGGRRGRRD